MACYFGECFVFQMILIILMIFHFMQYGNGFFETQTRYTNIEYFKSSIQLFSIIKLTTEYSKKYNYFQSIVYKYFRQTIIVRFSLSLFHTLSSVQRKVSISSRKYKSIPCVSSVVKIHFFLPKLHFFMN